MESEDSLLCLYGIATGAYPGPDEASPHPPSSFLRSTSVLCTRTTELEKISVNVWTGFIRLRIGSNGWLLWTRYEPLGSTKCRELFEQLNNYNLSKVYSAPW